MEKFEFEKKIEKLKNQNLALDRAIERAEAKLVRTSEELFEAKVQRIAMGEITRTTKEKVLRQFGYDE